MSHVAVFRSSSTSADRIAIGPVPSSVTVRRAVTPGVDRVTLIWPESGANKAIVSGWLEVTLKANGNTALAVPDVFAFGNLSGDANGDGTVSVGDLGILSTNFNKNTGMTVAQGDFNGDGAVTVGDLGILATAFNKTLAAPPTLGQLAAEPTKSSAPAATGEAPTSAGTSASKIQPPALVASSTDSATSDNPGTHVVTGLRRRATALVNLIRRP